MLTGIVILLVLGIVQGVLVTVGGRLLMRPDLAVWRGALRDRMWRWMRWPLCASPLLILMFGPLVIRTLLGQNARGLKPFDLLTLPLAAGLLILPALVACWHCLPPREEDPFPYARAAGTAWLIAVCNFGLGAMGWIGSML